MPKKSKTQAAAEIAAAEAAAPTPAHAEMARDAILAETDAEAPVGAEVVEDIADIVRDIEIAESLAQAEPVVQEPPVLDVSLSLDDLLTGVPQETVDRVRTATHQCLSDREAFEEKKKADNLSIQRTLKKVRSHLVRDPAARLLAAVDVDPGFINRGLRSDSCYNVYAIGKLADIVGWVNAGGASSLNAINAAILKSLVNFDRAGLPFTTDAAKAACSRNYPYHGDGVSRLVRHTVAPNTTKTQSSSTMQALETLGVVRVISGNRTNKVYAMTGTPLAGKIRELLAA